MRNIFENRIILSVRVTVNKYCEVVEFEETVSKQKHVSMVSTFYVLVNLGAESPNIKCFFRRRHVSLTLFVNIYSFYGPWL